MKQLGNQKSPPRDYFDIITGCCSTQFAPDHQKLISSYAGPLPKNSWNYRYFLPNDVVFAVGIIFFKLNPIFSNPILASSSTRGKSLSDTYPPSWNLWSISRSSWIGLPTTLTLSSVIIPGLCWGRNWMFLVKEHPYNINRCRHFLNCTTL